MRNYSISPYVSHNWRIIRKYLLELDKDIMSVQNYIDFANPNKIILNYVYNQDEVAFYNTENLITLNILRDNYARYQHFSSFSDLYDTFAVHYNVEENEKFTLNGVLYKVNFLPDIFYNYQALVDYFAHTGDCYVGELVLLATEGYMFLITDLDHEDVGGIQVENDYNGWYSPQEDERIYGINVDKLFPGQIIYNNFGNDITIYPTTDSPDVASGNIEYEILTQGTALFKILNQQKDYQILALDSTGDFYVFSQITNDGEVTFMLLPHATVEFGLNYLFSLVGQNARWCYFGEDALLTHLTLFAPTSWETSQYQAWWWNYQDEQRVVQICSRYRTIWTSSSVLSHEILQVNNGHYSEVFCDNWSTSTSEGIDMGSQSSYTINTNIINTLANYLNFRITLY